MEIKDSKDILISNSTPDKQSSCGQEYYFKFYSFGKYAQETIEHLLVNEIYAPSMMFMNDPFESLWHGCDVDNIMNRLDANFRDRINRRGIYCLCRSSKEDFPLTNDSILMWSHYADSHRGFCVIFSEAILKTNAQCPLAIKYVKDLVEVNNEIPYDPLSNEEIQRVIVHKSDIWQKENEVRLCFEHCGYYTIPENAIIGIFCGCNISEYNKSLLYGVATRKNWKFDVLQPSNQGFYFTRSTNDIGN